MENLTRNATERGSTEADIFRDPAVADLQLVSQAASGRYGTAPVDLPTGDGTAAGEEERKRLGWGECYSPRIEDREARQQFSQICQRMLCELADLELADYFRDGKLVDEGAGPVAEIGDLLERMFDCPFGDGESLKSAVVAIQSQVNNADWTDQTVRFLRDAMTFLSARYIVNDQTVDELYKIMEEHGLDPFRGSVSDRGIKTHYRLVEMKDD